MDINRLIHFVEVELNYKIKSIETEEKIISDAENLLKDETDIIKYFNSLLSSIHKHIIDEKLDVDDIEYYGADDGIPGMPIEVSKEMVTQISPDYYGLLGNFREGFISVDTRLRNPIAYTNSSNFAVSIGDDFNTLGIGFVRGLTKLRRLVVIELISAIIPNIGKENVNYPVYRTNGIFMEIDEFDGRMYSTTQTGKQHFARLEYDVGNLTMSSHINAIIRGGQQIYPLSSPLGNLDTMRIRLLDFLGQLFQFGNDSLIISTIGVSLP